MGGPLKYLPFSLAFLVIASRLAACAAPTPAAVPTASSTPDPCGPEHIAATITLVNDYVRQFDDYSVLASNVLQSQMVLVIPPMQEIRRNARDQAVPACLVELKGRALRYMDSTLDALLGFQATTDVDELATAVLRSRSNHEQYAIELARLLGATLAIPPPAPIDTATPQ